MIITRLLPNITSRRSVVNQSSRGGVSPDTIVLHSTEGSGFPGGWFNNPAAQASSHVAVGRKGNSERYVADASKAWTQGNWNPRSLSIEIVGFADGPQSQWTKAQVREVARWVAHWSIQYNIPITRRAGNGVCTHKDISGPGGHHDPGTFPVARCLEIARVIKAKRLKRR
jgi:N-acetyl-anhydromuramyl-L-alanine amidase AmpD